MALHPDIEGFLELAEFGRLTGRTYGLLTEFKTSDADTVFVSLGCAADNIGQIIIALGVTLTIAECLLTGILTPWQLI